MIIFLVLEISYPLEAQAEKNNTKKGLLNKFCIATLKSKLDIKNKNNFTEISNFTCKCFFKKYNSGLSIRKSRIYCKDRASEKYNL
tara:strand:+ start:251 stop:508 length:258 start_codon:yes stop_codon:yes gene_type:complete